VLYSVDPPCGDNISVTILADIAANTTEITIYDPFNIPNDTFYTFPINYTFQFPYVYDVEINLENINGCTTDSTIILHTFPEPHADFTLEPDSGCAPLGVHFEYNSSIPDITTNYIQSLTDHGLQIDSIDSWVWIFDDPFPISDYKLNGDTTYHLYPNSSIYYPSLEVTTNNLCTDIITKPVVVYPTPNASLLVTPVIPGTYEIKSVSDYSPLDSFDFWHFWTITTISALGDTIISDSVSPITQPPWVQTNQHDVPDYPGNNVNIWEYIFTSGDPMKDAQATICLILENTTGYICPAEACTTIIDPIPFYGLWVPNAIHPGITSNGYETFLPKGKGILIDENGVSQYELAIFDKFGSIIFRTDSIDPTDGSPVVGWDGTKNGEPLPQGTYVWKIYAQFSDGTYWDGTGLGYGKASEDGDKDPWIDRKQTGLRSGAVYLIR
ncbi:MAG: hypothetical protein ACKVJA_06175, partial [Flavobacteriales bacterium]